MGERERGLEQIKLLVESDQAAVWDGIQAVEELRTWVIEAAGKRMSKKDMELFAMNLQRIELALHQSTHWMAQLRRSLPDTFRIVCGQQQTDL